MADDDDDDDNNDDDNNDDDAEMLFCLFMYVECVTEERKRRESDSDSFRNRTKAETNNE